MLMRSKLFAVFHQVIHIWLNNNFNYRPDNPNAQFYVVGNAEMLSASDNSRYPDHCKPKNYRLKIALRPLLDKPMAIWHSKSWCGELGFNGLMCGCFSFGPSCQAPFWGYITTLKRY